MSNDSTLTKQVQQHDQVSEQQARESLTSYSVLSTTGARACARTREGTEAETRAAIMRGWYVDACEYYQDAFDRRCTQLVRRTIAEAIGAGMTVDVLRAAMDATQLAPRPSWAYCAAILARCQRDGILTAEDWARDHKAWSRRRNPALQYEQRQYAEDDFDQDYFLDVVAKYGSGAGA